MCWPIVTAERSDWNWLIHIILCSVLHLVLVLRNTYCINSSITIGHPAYVCIHWAQTGHQSQPSFSVPMKLKHMTFHNCVFSSILGKRKMLFWIISNLPIAGVARVCRPTSWAGPRPSRKSLNWLLAPRLTPGKIKLTQRTQRTGLNIRKGPVSTLYTVSSFCCQSLFTAWKHIGNCPSHRIHHRKHYSFNLIQSKFVFIIAPLSPFLWTMCSLYHTVFTVTWHILLDIQPLNMLPSKLHCHIHMLY